MKIKFTSDDELHRNKTIEIPSKTIAQILSRPFLR